MKDGFAIVLLILGSFFILILGAIGLEIIQTKQAISKAFLEVQRLQKEKKFEQATQKLEDLENNFLVRYFGFGKREIDREIEKMERMIEEIKIEEEKKGEGEKEGPKEVEKIEVKDCKDDLDCLIESAKNCNLAKVRDRIFLELEVMTQMSCFLLKVEEKKMENAFWLLRLKNFIN